MESPVTPVKQDAFRSLVEGRITTEQYLRSLEERVEELRDAERPAQHPTPQAA
jgi:hypothetical protein